MDAFQSGDHSSPSGDHSGPAGDALPPNVAPQAAAAPPAPINSAIAVSTGPVSTAWDQALAAALHDVPVPAGLSARLLARLPAPAVENGRRPAVRIAAAGRGRRRWLQASAAALACAASVTVAIVFFNQPTPELGSESVMEAVRSWQHQQAALGPLEHVAPPEDYSPGSFLMPGCLVGWCSLAIPLLGREGVAYQLVGPRRNRATLYVLDFDGPRSAPRLLLNTTSPLENLLTTDGQTSSTWTDGVRLYVLVADGNERDFRALVRAPRSMA